MKDHYLIAVVGSLFTVAITCEAQTVATSGDPSHLSLRQGSADGKLAAPTTPGATPGTQAKRPTEITAREATFDNRTHFATFAGDVVVTGEFNVTCDALTVYLKKPPEKAAPPTGGQPPATPNGQPLAKPVPNAGPGAAKPGIAPALKPEGDDAGSSIEKAVAEGHVIITQDKTDADGKTQRYRGTGKKAIYESGTGNITLFGLPTVEQVTSDSASKKILAREEGCVMILNRAGKIEVNGYHTTTLQEASAPNKNQR